MITIDYQSRTPIYEQIVEKFQMLIIKGILPPGSRMPSVRSLAVELSINPNTIQKAFSTLEQQGYIFPIKGKGNFISQNTALIEKKKENLMSEISRTLTQAKDLGITESECTAILKGVYQKGGVL